jgi:hypothetical protein
LAELPVSSRHAIAKLRAGIQRCGRLGLYSGMSLA